MNLIPIPYSYYCSTWCVSVYLSKLKHITQLFLSHIAHLYCFAGPGENENVSDDDLLEAVQGQSRAEPAAELDSVRTGPVMARRSLSLSKRQRL